MSHSHDVPPIQHILLWGKDPEIIKRAFLLLNEYYWDRICAFTAQEIEHLIQEMEFDEASKKIEEYDFHVIKIHDNHAELILINNERYIEFDDEDLLDAVEKLTQKVISKHVSEQKLLDQ